MARRWCDLLTTGGLLFLLLFTPLAFGAVHPWAFSLMESTIFFLAIVWMLKLLITRADQKPLPVLRTQAGLGSDLQPHTSLLRSPYLPMLLFFALVLFQMVPLPPPVLTQLSPRTHELYSQALAGWPEKSVFADLSAMAPSVSLTGRWQSLAIWREGTMGELLKFLAYAALFGLVILYPWGGRHRSLDDARAKVHDRLITVICCVGFLIALLALLQKATWNGKILWFFIPAQWGSARPDLSPRASGPFVSPDHLAGYLAMIIPLLAAKVAGGGGRVPAAAERLTSRVFFGLSLAIVLAALLATGSRGGWAAAIFGGGIFLWLSRSPTAKRQRVMGRAVVISLSVVPLLLFSLVVLGPKGRRDMDLRLHQTLVQGEGLASRVKVWRDSLPMVRDFPVFGVGLGGWQKLFPRYRTAPRGYGNYSQAHNDYLEWLCEVGVVGGLLMVWFSLAVAKTIFAFRPDQSHSALRAGLLGAIGAMALHEFFDFNLQITANALLFTLLLGLTYRISLGSQREMIPTRALTVPVMVLALLALAAAVRQGKGRGELADQPAARKEEKIVQALRPLLRDPAQARYHFQMARVLDPASEAEAFYQRAIFFDPTHPWYHDHYAHFLWRRQRVEESLQQIRQAVFHEPSLDAHRYLQSDQVDKTDARVLAAAEEGLIEALRRWPQQDAIESDLAALYGWQGRWGAQATLYVQAARQQGSPGLLVKGAIASLKAHDYRAAEMTLREAIAADPTRPEPYCYLALDVLAAAGRYEEAFALLREGERKVVHPYYLHMVDGYLAHSQRDYEGAIASLSAAIQERPRSADAHQQLGLVYLDRGHYDRAALAFRRVIQLTPRAAKAYYSLGLAEEGRYRLAEAEKAFARALELDPENDTFAMKLAELRKLFQQTASSPEPEIRAIEEALSVVQ